MDNETVRHLFISLKEDIRELKRDVGVIIQHHDDRLGELEQFRWRWAGALAAIVVLIELGMKLIGAGAFK